MSNATNGHGGSPRRRTRRAASAGASHPGPEVNAGSAQTPLLFGTRKKLNAGNVRHPVGVIWSPLNCAILGIDVAAVSGAAVRIRGRLVMSCQIDATRPELVSEVVLYAMRAAANSGVPLVVVLERPFGGSMRVLVGLGMARGYWMAGLRRAGHSTRRVISVMPNTWRAGVFGKGWARAARDVIRAHELATACAEAGRADLGADEAAAVCISKWGSCAPQVAERLGKR